MLNDLLNGRRNLTVTTALMFEAALDVPADSLMNLQLKYNMQVAKNDDSFMERLSLIRNMQQCFKRKKVMTICCGALP